MSFSAVVTRDDRVLVSYCGRQVVVLSGADARTVIERLGRAEDVAAEQSVLAKATGNFKRGNERRVG
ncbi:hypothetical protein [Gaiella sp.]|uniref:hypothetical protein n=1 Tax=Gaiella sp. TaxID=2663207 RepID=UPI0039836076